METFTQTSTEPYDKHHYKLVYSNSESVVFKTYLEIQEAWWNTPSDFLSHVEVLDKKQPRGFKK
jgi:hypothetical protein